MSGKATRLYPLPPRVIPAAEIYDDLELPSAGRRESSRPYVIINMVSSVDGRTAVEGKASRLGSQADRQTMRNLRAKADAVMIGANTLRAERLSLGLDDPASRQPLAIVVASNSGDVPIDRNLIVTPGQRTLIIFPSGATLRGPHNADQLEAPTTPEGEIDLEAAFEILKVECAVEVLLIEGGPVLNHAAVSRGLVDELFLTLAPKLVGGSDEHTPTILTGELPSPRDAMLLSAHSSGGELFLRYGLFST